jgi:hypothetical protein
VLCYLGFTYTDDLTENRLEADIEANREKAWMEVETEYFYVHGFFALIYGHWQEQHALKRFAGPLATAPKRSVQLMFFT